eukprot:842734-Rhodomonas_salina.1
MKLEAIYAMLFQRQVALARAMPVRAPTRCPVPASRMVLCAVLGQRMRMLRCFCCGTGRCAGTALLCAGTVIALCWYCVALCWYCDGVSCRAVARCAVLKLHTLAGHTAVPRDPWAQGATPYAMSGTDIVYGPMLPPYAMSGTSILYGPMLPPTPCP